MATFIGLIMNSKCQQTLIFRLFLMIGGLMLMFAMWWAYFDRSEQHHHVKGVRPFVWGYGHYFVL